MLVFFLSLVPRYLIYVTKRDIFELEGGEDESEENQDWTNLLNLVNMLDRPYHVME